MDAKAAIDLPSVADSPAAEPDSSLPDAKQSEHTRQAWLTVAGSVLVYFVSFGFMTSFGYFQTHYTQNDLSEWSPGLIALIGSMQLGLMNVIGPVAGALFDVYGSKWPYLGGAVGAIVSCIGLSFAQPQQIWQYFLSQGLLYGLSVPFGTMVALAVTSQHFERNRALAMGIIAAGSAAGGACFPVMLAKLVPAIGFRWTMRVIPLLFLFAYGIAIVISRPKNPPRKMKSIREIVDFGGFRDVRYLVLAIATVIGNLGLYVPINYMELYFQQYFPGAAIGSYSLTIINGASFFGRILGGLAADRLGTLNVLYPVTIICGIFNLTMWLRASSPAVAVAFCVLYGICSGTYISVMPSIIVRISPPTKTGARLGAFFSLSAIGVFTGTPIGGAFLPNETKEEFQHLILFAGATMTCSGLLLLYGRWLCHHNMRTKW